MNNNQGRRRTRRARQLRKQKNTQISRILLTICMMALVAVVSIGGTLAWLQDQSTPVTNTFTTSNIEIKLEETNPVTQEKEEADADTQVSNSYEMIPGKTVAKDPTVTVEAGSEKCWVFVKVEEQFTPVTVAGETYDFDDFINYTVKNTTDTPWLPIEEGSNVYYILQEEIADAGEDATYSVLLNDQFTTNPSVTKEMMEAVTEDNYPKLVITAYAIQWDSLKNGTADVATAAEAWAVLNP